MNQVLVHLQGSVATVQLESKTFSTGSRGYYGNGKVSGTDGKKYQVNINVIEIGSKPKDKDGK